MINADHVVEVLLDTLAERVADKLASRMGKPAHRYADAKHNPLGAARAFLDAARRGDFASFKRGRVVVARWEDVEGYIETRRRSVRPRMAGLDNDRALLERAGVRLRRAGGAKR
jgi:hypothetical protein